MTTNPLFTYGTPPTPGECRDVGTLVVDDTVRADTAAKQQIEYLAVHVGRSVPAYRRALSAVAVLESSGALPAKAFVEGLGVVCVGADDSWSVHA